MPELDVTVPAAFRVKAAPAPHVSVRAGTQVILVPTPGPPGPQGAAGTGAYFMEIPIGTINGSNKTYTTSQPFVAGSTSVFLNGLLEHYYTETATGVIFDDAPLTGDTIKIGYTIA